MVQIGDVRLAGAGGVAAAPDTVDDPIGAVDDPIVGVEEKFGAALVIGLPEFKAEPAVAVATGWAVGWVGVVTARAWGVGAKLC